MSKSRFDWRHQYDDDRDAFEREISGAANHEPSMTQQHHAEDADLNVLVKRFGITDGAIPPAAMDPRYYGDFTDAVDFRTSLDRVRSAQERFEQLPAELRDKFGHDPIKLYAWVTDEKNAEEAVKLGLLKELPIQQAAPPTATPPSTDTK